ncbi:MAG: 16S rRNA (guanine(527)-N(7))-methyltransferase RsmG [Pseudobdellovibrionaceae bacterium]|nr:16S rRNA (guanine(527)-N(7))-methyltransferase RsmG [Bdellovibrionales bacterium]USN46852.1 MAG: 16S rRNA (guanine(527)-N(7))-methyltransferase RsmG [Pseudobdellovibrionaceae bacterium]
MSDKEDDDLDVRPDGVEWRIASWFPDLPDELVGRLRVFQAELLRFNGRINLVSPRTEAQSDLIHFADSILGGRIVLEHTKNERIYDIGSGNGFPGLVMALLARERQFVLVEKDGRKSEFLRHIAGRMELKNVDIQTVRFEELAPQSISCAVSRGFASVSRAVMTARSCCSKGCEYFHFKSENWSTEIAEMPSQLCAFWEPSLVGTYTLPTRTTQMAIVLTKKLVE